MVEVILLIFVVATLVSGALLWVAIKLFDSGNAKNTLPITFGVAALLNAISFMPFLGGLFSLILLVTLLYKMYDLGIGQTFMVLIFLVAVNLGLRGFLEGLLQGQ